MRSPAAIALLLIPLMVSPHTRADAQIIGGRGALRDPDGLPHVDPSRLEDSVLILGEIGRDPATGGMNRTAFSPADLEARRWFVSQLEAAGMQVRLDPAANIIGRIEGTDPTRSAIVLGSHLDSVPQGGRFDGALGLMVALEVVRSLSDLGITLTHPLEIVSFTDEEGGLVGSRAWIGTLDATDLEREYGGRNFAQVLRELGLDPADVGAAIRAPSDVGAYVELHVEQGRVLEQEGEQIGIVEGIVALDEFEVTVVGSANHAGTTRMKDRRDPMAAAAKMIDQVRAIAIEMGGSLVATVGRIEALPGAPNVIPSTVRFSIDIRDPGRLVVDRAVEILRSRFTSIARGEGVAVSWRTLVQIPPAPAHPLLLQTFREVAADYGYPHRVMPSGAGHDAQSIARIAPMGMIFVPSVGGISHAPGEFTRFVDAAAGADVILGAVILLDQRLP